MIAREFVNLANRSQKMTPAGEPFQLADLGFAGPASIFVSLSKNWNWRRIQGSRLLSLRIAGAATSKPRRRVRLEPEMRREIS